MIEVFYEPEYSMFASRRIAAAECKLGMDTLEMIDANIVASFSVQPD